MGACGLAVELVCWVQGWLLDGFWMVLNKQWNNMVWIPQCFHLFAWKNPAIHHFCFGLPVCCWLERILSPLEKLLASAMLRAAISFQTLHFSQLMCLLFLKKSPFSKSSKYYLYSCVFQTKCNIPFLRYQLKFNKWLNNTHFKSSTTCLCFKHFYFMQ